MDLNKFIGYTKDEVLKILDKEEIKYSIVEFEDNKIFDTLLLVKYESKENGDVTLYFDRFRLNI